MREIAKTMLVRKEAERKMREEPRRYPMENTRRIGFNVDYDRYENRYNPRSGYDMYDGRDMPRNEYDYNYDYRYEPSFRRETERPYEAGHDYDKPRRVGLTLMKGEQEHEHGRYGNLDEWPKQMKNADGTIGAHWTRDQVNQLANSKGFKGDRDELFIALNAVYSDLSEVFKKHGMNNLDAYFDFTKAFWFDDKDAVPDKINAYYKYVVKHD